MPDTSISGDRVVRELTELIARRGKPGMINSDNGAEHTSYAVLAWCRELGSEWHYIAPGRPMQNGCVESFDGSMALSVSLLSPADESGGVRSNFSAKAPLKWGATQSRTERCSCFAAPYLSNCNNGPVVSHRPSRKSPMIPERHR